MSETDDDDLAELLETVRLEERKKIAVAIMRHGFDPGRYTLTDAARPGNNALRVMELVRDDCMRIAANGGRLP